MDARERMRNRILATQGQRRPEHGTTLGDVRALVRQYLPDLEDEEPEGYEAFAERPEIPGVTDSTGTVEPVQPLSPRERMRASILGGSAGPDWSTGSTPGAPGLPSFSTSASAGPQSAVEPESVSAVDRAKGVARWALDTGFGLVEPVMLAQDVAMLATHTLAENWQQRSVVIDGRTYLAGSAEATLRAMQAGYFKNSVVTHPETGEVMTADQALDYIDNQSSLVGALWDNFFSADRKIQWGNYAPLGEVPERPVDGAGLLEITGLDGGNEGVRRWAGLALDLVYDPLLVGGAIRGSARAVAYAAGRRAGSAARWGDNIAEGLNTAIRGADDAARRVDSDVLTNWGRNRASPAQQRVDSMRSTFDDRMRVMERETGWEYMSPDALPAGARPAVPRPTTVGRVGDAAASAAASAAAQASGAARSGIRAAVRDTRAAINSHFLENRMALEAANPGLLATTDRLVDFGDAIDRAMSLGPVARGVWTNADRLTGGRASEWFENRWAAVVLALQNPGEAIMGMPGILSDFTRTALHWSLPPSARGRVFVGRGVDAAASTRGNPVYLADGVGVPASSAAASFGESLPDVARLARQQGQRVSNAEAENLMGLLNDTLGWVPEAWGRRLSSAFRGMPRLFRSVDDVPESVQAAMMSAAFDTLNLAGNPMLARGVNLTDDAARAADAVRMPGSTTGFSARPTAQAEASRQIFDDDLRNLRERVTGDSPFVPLDDAARPVYDMTRYDTEFDKSLQHVMDTARSAGVTSLRELADIEDRFRRLTEGFARIDARLGLELSGLPWVRESFTEGAMVRFGLTAEEAGNLFVDVWAAKIANPDVQVADMIVRGRMPHLRANPSGVPMVTPPRPPAPSDVPATRRPNPLSARGTTFESRAARQARVGARVRYDRTPGPAPRPVVAPVASDVPLAPRQPGSPALPGSPTGVTPTTVMPSAGYDLPGGTARIIPIAPARAGDPTGTALSVAVPAERWAEDAANLAEGVRVGDILDGLEVFNRLSLDSFFMSFPEGHIRRAYSVWADAGSFERYYQALSKGKLIPNNVLTEDIVGAAFKDNPVAAQAFNDLLGALDTPLRRQDQGRRQAARTEALVEDAMRGGVSRAAAEAQVRDQLGSLFSQSGEAFTGSQFIVRQDQGIKHLAEAFMASDDKLSRVQAGRLAEDAWNRVFAQMSNSQGEWIKPFQENLDQLRRWMDDNRDILSGNNRGVAASGAMRERQDLDIVMESIIGAAGNPLVSGVESVEAARRLLPMQDFMRSIYIDAMRGGFVVNVPGGSGAYTNPSTGVRYVRIPENQRHIYGGFASRPARDGNEAVNTFVHPFLKKEIDDVLRGRSYTPPVLNRLRSMISGGYLASPHIGLTNLMGNIYAATVGGGGLSITSLVSNMIQVLPEMHRKESPWFRRLQELTSIDDVSAVSADVMRREAGRFRLDAVSGDGSLLNHLANTWEAILRKPFNVGLLGLDGFQFMDQWVRTAAFKGHFERLVSQGARATDVMADSERVGSALHQAADFARLSALDYGQIPKVVEVARDWGVWMFPGFPLLIGGRNINAALNSPGAFALWDRAGEAVAHAVVDPEERAAVQVGMPDWLKAEYGVPVDAWTEDDGSYHANVIPFNQLVPTRNMFGAPMLESLVGAGLFGPLVDIVRANSTGSGEGPMSVEFGRRVFAPESGPLERLRDIGNFAYTSYAPALARRLFTPGYRERGASGVLPAAGRAVGMAVNPELWASYNQFANEQAGRRRRGLGGEILATWLRSPQTVTTSGPLVSAQRSYNQAAQQHREVITGLRESALHLQFRDEDAYLDKLAEIDVLQAEFHAEWGPVMEIINQAQRRAFERREQLQQQVP